MIKIPKFNNQIFSDYLFVFLTYGISFLCTLFVYYYISHQYNHLEFEKYNLSRRVISVVFVLLMMGLVVALPRFIALMPKDRLYSYKISANLIVALFLVIIITFTFFILVVLFPKFFGILFWNTDQYSFLLITISCFLISLGVFTVIFSFARGLSSMIYANIMTILNILIPIFGLLFVKNIESYYWITTASNFLISIVFLTLLFKKYNLKILTKIRVLFEQGKSLLHYGLPRIPGDLALEGLFSIPVFIIAHTNGSSSASNLGFAVALIPMVGTFLSPVSLVLLPYSAKMITQKDFYGLKKHINLLFKLFIPAITFVIVLLYFLSGYIVELYLNKINPEVESYIRIISLVFIPYIVYLIVRSVNDTAYFKPVNALNAILALIILLGTTGIVYFFKLYNNPVLVGLVTGIYALGVLSYFSYKRIFNI